MRGADTPRSRKVAIVGTGMIGGGWIKLFARAGYDVALYDVSEELRRAALMAAHAQLRDEFGATLMRSEFQLTNGAVVSAAPSLELAVRDVCYVQESIPENVELKQALFEQLDRLAASEVVLASSSSSIPPDRFLLTSRAPERCVVAHPFSPPDAIPLVEVVPSSRTEAATIERTIEILRELKREPITVRRPVVGYAVNRFQALVIAEGLHLVAAGVLSPEDVDKCLKFGLGRRWCFMGPFETMDLNSRHGFKEYVEKFYSSCYRPVLDDMYPLASWPEQAIEEVEAWRRAELGSVPALDSRRAWRDATLLWLGKELERVALEGRSSKEVREQAVS